MTPETVASAPGASPTVSASTKREPSLGRIVLYRVAEPNSEARFNGIQVGDQLPATVVRVWKDADGRVTSVNLRVHCDAPHDCWVTSVTEGDANAQWSWPTIQ